MEDTTPVLVEKAKFQKILKGYRPSDDAIEALHNTRTLVLVGPTGSGKNTLITHLVKAGRFYFVLSDTTRPPRMHDNRMEQNGEFYWHITEQDFLAGLERGDYLEAAVIHDQQVSGSNNSEYKKASEQGKIAVTDIESIYGVPVFREYSDKITFIFMVPPSFDEWMRRLKHRGEMTEKELQNRMISADEEILTALQRPYYHFIVSDDIADNVRTVTDLMDKGIELRDNDSARAQTEQLLQDIREYAKQHSFSVD